MTFTLFLDSNIMESKKHIKNIIGFCGTISTKITFAIHLNNYNLSLSELTKAYDDIFNYFRNEDQNRRNEFLNNSELKKTILDKYKSPQEISEYFDNLHQYDLLELEEIKKQLIKFKNQSVLTKSFVQDKIGKNRFVRTSLPNENFLESFFSFHSYSTIGGLYKIYSFKMDQKMIQYLLHEGNLMKFFTLGDIDFLEDPTIFTNNQPILSISTHERTTTLFLSDEQYSQFKGLNIPYSINRV